jgi:hypothetical protein
MYLRFPTNEVASCSESSANSLAMTARHGGAPTWNDLDVRSIATKPIDAAFMHKLGAALTKSGEQAQAQLGSKDAHLHDLAREMGLDLGRLATGELGR